MWAPDKLISEDLDTLVLSSRASAASYLSQLVDRYCPGLRETGAGAEFRKLVELSTKMQIVGRAWTEIAGFTFDERRERISSLFGACCHIGDSLLDDFGAAVSREYVQRFEILYTQGWFEVRNDLDRIFYVVVTRLFAERDVLQPMLRQALWSLFKVEALDVQLSLEPPVCRSDRLAALKRCARDRSGHAITVLALFLLPKLSLKQHRVLYSCGSLVSYIDDYGDFYYDRIQRKATYMNSVGNPARSLRRAFAKNLELVDSEIAPSHGRELLKTFLHRYYFSRLRKHQQEKYRGDNSRPVYE